MAGELFGFVLELFAFGATSTCEDDRRRVRRREVAGLLERAAELLGGRYRKPWFRAPRVEGYVEGRSVDVIWRGGGRVDVRLPARPEHEAWGRPGPWWRRLFGRAEPALEGPAHVIEALGPLLREGRLVRFDLTGGWLSARVSAPRDPARLVAVVRALADAAWASPRVSVRAVAREDAGPRVAARPARKARAEADLRCPYCHDEIGPDAPVARCAACDATHHPTCFEEGGGCSIAGCRERTARAARARA